MLFRSVQRTGVSGLIVGSTAETMLRQVECAVLAVKPEGFVSPVVLDWEDVEPLVGRKQTANHQESELEVA